MANKVGRPKTDRSAQIVVNVRQDTRDALEKIAKEHNYSVAGFVRLLIDNYLMDTVPDGLIGDTPHETRRRISEIFFTRFLMLANNAERVQRKADEVNYEKRKQEGKGILEI